MAFESRHASISKAEPGEEEKSSETLLTKFNGGTSSSTSLQPRRVTFKKVTFGRNALFLTGIIVGNCITMGLLTYVLWHYSQKSELTKMAKRFFNTAAILISTVLSLGIGYLLDSLGLLGRGYLLTKRPHNLRAIGYIVRGSMASQAKLVINKIMIRNFDQTAGMVLNFIILSIAGTLSIAFLGLAFNVEENLRRLPSLQVTPWPYPRDYWSNTSYVDSPDNYSLPEISTFGSSGWISNQRYFPNPKPPYDFLKSLKNFTGADLHQTIEGDTVSYRYDIVNFEDSMKPVPSGRFVVGKAKCGKVEVLSQDANGFQYLEDGQNKTFKYAPDTSFDLTYDPSPEVSDTVRYIAPWRGTAKTGFLECGENCLEIWVSPWKIPNEKSTFTLLFRCQNSVIPPEPAPPELSVNTSNHTLNFPNDLTYWIPTLPAFHETTVVADNETDFDLYRDHTLGYDEPTNKFLMSAIQSPEGHLWAAATLSRFTAILAMQLNRVVMPKLEVRKGKDTIISTLAVKWPRVLALLGALLAFQIVMVKVVLWFTYGGVYVQDDVETLGNLLGQFSPGMVGPLTARTSRVLFRIKPVPAETADGVKGYSLVVQQANGILE